MRNVSTMWQTITNGKYNFSLLIVVFVYIELISRKKHVKIITKINSNVFSLQMYKCIGYWIVRITLTDDTPNLVSINTVRIDSCPESVVELIGNSVISHITEISLTIQIGSYENTARKNIQWFRQSECVCILKKKDLITLPQGMFNAHEELDDSWITSQRKLIDWITRKYF